MNIKCKSPRRQLTVPVHEPRTFCRIVGEEVGPDGKTDLLIEPITDPREQEAARKRYEAVIRLKFEEVMKKHSLRSPAIFGDGGGI
jgi:hypothetical protein